MIYSFNDDDYLDIRQCYDRIFVPYHFMFPSHKHKGFEIMYIVNGNVSVDVYDDAGIRKVDIYNLFPGDFIFLNSARLHRLRVAETGARIVNIEVTSCREMLYAGQRTLGRMAKYDDTLREFFNYDPETFRLYDDRNLFDTMFLLVQKYFIAAENKVNDMVLHNLLFVLLIDVASLYLDSLHMYRGHAYIKKAIFLIENTLGAISPEELASSVGISRNYLHRLFKTCFGKSVSEYITDYKIKRACNRFKRLIDMRISDVATELGYTNLLGFERAFKRVKGITPGEYKQKIRAASNTWINRWN